MADSEAKLNVARRRLQLLQAGARDEQVNRARAELEMARAHFASAETDLADAVLHAPVDGIVARRRVQAGEVVEDKQGVFQIVENGKTWVVANLEEGQIARVAVGQPVEVVVDAYPSRVFRARVGPQFAATLSRFSLLSSSSASGSFIKVTQRVPVRIDWAQDTLPPLVPGLNVTVRIQVDSN
jgi:membrane fusion protein (multidrug efflux system)